MKNEKVEIQKYKMNIFNFFILPFDFLIVYPNPIAL